MGIAFELLVKDGAFTATAGGTINQFTFVKLSADNTVVACAATTDKPIGVAQAGATSGQTVQVQVYGLTKMVASAALTAGNSVGTDASGNAAPYVEGTDTTKYIAGQVVVGVGAANSLATVALHSPHRAT